MPGEKRREQMVSILGVLILAVALPGILKLTNSVVRYFVGAEGRLAAITVDSERVLGPMPQPWRALAQGGDQLQTFLDDTAAKVAAVKPKYIRIDHIYDGFNVVAKDGRNLKFNWSELDKLVDKITLTGAVPFFSLSYMPEAISSGDITNAPTDWNDWAMVVQKTIEHYSGERKLIGVYYEVWNEPDLFGKWKIGGSKDYRKLYQYASMGASRASTAQEFKLGGPGTTGLYKNWMDGFFPYVLENNLRLDFFSWHRYDLDVEKYVEDVNNVDAWLDKHPYFSKVEKIVTEMGPQSDRGGANDTRIGAAHLVAVMRELMFKIAYGMSFAVKGDWGIVDKPRYEALKMLSRLGGQRISLTGEGSWVRAIGAKNDRVTQVLLTNYDAKGGHTELVPVSFLGITDQSYNLRKIMYTGNQLFQTQQRVATTAAILQQEVPMTPNSLVLLELEPVVKP